MVLPGGAARRAAWMDSPGWTTNSAAPAGASPNIDAAMAPRSRADNRRIRHPPRSWPEARPRRCRGSTVRPEAPVPQRSPQLDLDQGGEGAELLELALVQHPGPVVDHAQGPHPAAVRELEGGAGVEAGPGLLPYERVVGEAVVLEQVGDLEDLRAEDGVGAQRLVPRRLHHGRSPVGLEPLPPGID